MIALRPPEQVMRLARMGSFHRTRLSFMPTLLRRLERENWRYEKRLWEIDGRGVGRAVLSVHGPQRSYSLVCFAHDLPDHMRSDRVIATAWDSTFALFDGIPDEDDLQRLQANVPKQEAGRVSDRELSLSRANRSARLFNHVLDRLAAGEQPDQATVDGVGYLMRTTAVYGSGKFGAADRVATRERPELRGPFQTEMLAVWLIRAFVLDLVEHLARARGGDQATTLNADMRRSFGIGNATGLGMAPFLMNHPTLLNNWMMARETALQRVRELPNADADQIVVFRHAIDAAIDNATAWTSDHTIQLEKLDLLRRDLTSLRTHAHEAATFAQSEPWDRLWRWGEETLGLEGQEALVGLLLEPHGEIVDGLSDCMDANEEDAFMIDGGMSIDDLRSLIDEHYGWALDTNYSADGGDHQFWYVSEEKLEPRLGARHDEPGADLELPLATGRDVKELMAVLDAESGNVADFLARAPEFRHVVRRVQRAPRYPYAEIRDNLIDAGMLPIDLLRCKLSFFGASRFDPRSDRWVRICMYQGAPFPHELLGAA